MHLQWHSGTLWVEAMGSNLDNVKGLTPDISLCRKNEMTFLNRLKYVFVMNVIFVGVGVVTAIIFGLEIGEVLFSGKVFLSSADSKFFSCATA
jgi:hypothetical protein